MAQPAFVANSLFAGNPTSSTSTPPSAVIAPPGSGNSNNTFLMTASPVRNRKSASDGYKPKIITTVGAKPACLVNASVNYVGDDLIYAFGGFDQYTDEGELRLGSLGPTSMLTRGCSLQPCSEAELDVAPMAVGRQLWRHPGRSDGYVDCVGSLCSPLC